MLVKKVGDIMSHMKEINVSDASRVSGQAPKGDYTLEFIQVISAVLALDQNVQQDVLVNTPPIPFHFYLVLVQFDKHMKYSQVL